MFVKCWWVYTPGPNVLKGKAFQLYVSKNIDDLIVLIIFLMPSIIIPLLQPFIFCRLDCVNDISDAICGRYSSYIYIYVCVCVCIISPDFISDSSGRLLLELMLTDIYVAAWRHQVTISSNRLRPSPHTSGTYWLLGTFIVSIMVPVTVDNGDAANWRKEKICNQIVKIEQIPWENINIIFKWSISWYHLIPIVQYAL